MNDKQKKATAEFNKGWEAYAYGKNIDACPFSKGSEEARLWCYGWFEADRDPLARLERTIPNYI